jgi:hypothetical protein
VIQWAFGEARRITEAENGATALFPHRHINTVAETFVIVQGWGKVGNRDGHTLTGVTLAGKVGPLNKRYTIDADANVLYVIGGVELDGKPQLGANGDCLISEPVFLQQLGQFIWLDDGERT